MNHCSIARTNEGNPTWSAAWRLACEAATLLRMPLALRRAELAVQEREKRRQALEVEMLRKFYAVRRKG